tara:strand:+ start:310 stop:606 length:297 start_codon:yes stop_codon:yes gene_type:complete
MLIDNQIDVDNSVVIVERIPDQGMYSFYLLIYKTAKEYNYPYSPILNDKEDWDYYKNSQLLWDDINMIKSWLNLNAGIKNYTWKFYKDHFGRWPNKED